MMTIRRLSSELQSAELTIDIQMHNIRHELRTVIADGFCPGKRAVPSSRSLSAVPAPANCQQFSVHIPVLSYSAAPVRCCFHVLCKRWACRKAK